MAASRMTDPRKLFEFLESSRLVNMEMPLSDLARSVSKLEEVAGYVLAWEKYVLVVASDVVVDTPATRA